MLGEELQLLGSLFAIIPRLGLPTAVLGTPGSPRMAIKAETSLV